MAHEESTTQPADAGPVERPVRPKRCPKCNTYMMHEEGEPWDAPEWLCPKCHHAEPATNPRPSQTGPGIEKAHADARQLQHCAIAVSDWLAGGCDVHDIPRLHIAALVEWTKVTTAEAADLVA